MDTGNNTADHSLCLICSSSVNPSDDYDDDQSSVIIFLFSTLLEIPQNKVVVQLQNKLITQQLITNWYCKPCKKLITSAKHTYTQILELTRKFRKVQKQIVEQFSTSNHDDDHGGLLELCTNFLDKNDFNEFGYPLVVKNPATFLSSTRPPKCQEDDDDNLHVENMKEEPFSDNEQDEGHDDSEFGAGEDEEPPEDYFESAAVYSADEASENGSDSDFEPPNKAVKKVPIKISPSLSSAPRGKGNRKSLPSTSGEPPLKKRKSDPPIKRSKFDLLYPSYPERLKDPTTQKFHCLEPFCLKTYPRKNALEAHIIIQHLQDNFYKCEEPNCGKSYAQPEHLKDHVSWHAGIPRWKCEEKVTPPDGGILQCTEAFFSRKKLNRHVQQVHQRDKQFICEICGNNFSCQDYLTSHKYEKHKDKQKEDVAKATLSLICNYCGKSFNVKASLEVHINLVHEKTVGGFECQFCECKFIVKICLKRHLWRAHQFSLEGYSPPKPKNKIEEQPFRCEVKGCKVGFQREPSLRKHMEERHGGGGREMEEGTGGVYQFSCKYCGKGFHVKNKLESHQTAHENKESKPFSCEICGKGFAVLRYLNLHKKSIHKIGSAGKARQIDLKN